MAVPEKLKQPRILVGMVLLATLGGVALFFGLGSGPPHQSLPARLTDGEFWRLVTTLSEASGYFRSENLVSNESSFQDVIPELKRRIRPGGVYLGVGPDQNFTYITALQPKLAFIVDIRRQNLLEHLMYKAIIELSSNRAEFLSMLFSRPLPNSATNQTSLPELLQEISAAEGSGAWFEKNLGRIKQQLVQRHQFALETGDLETIRHVFQAFLTAGPQIRYNFPSPWSWRRFPTYAELVVESDLDGENHGYLASEENFQVLRELQTENRIVPLVGDFAGDLALRGVGRYLKQHSASVDVFYTSNVEFYLFQGEQWRRFFSNVGELPMDDNSMFVRAYFNNQFPSPRSNGRSASLVDGMADLVAAFRGGKIRSYYDVIDRSN